MKVGDHVHWTHVTCTNQTMTLKRREGVIHRIDGSVAWVKIDRNGYANVALVRLRMLDEASQITEFVEAMQETL